MPKYTKEFKIKTIMEYLTGELGGHKTLAKNIIFLSLLSGDG
ncbi:MAG: hypothetical protein ACLUJE_02415 [Anaerococcus sp.]